MKQRGLRLLIKRSVDFSAAGALLVATSPLMAAAAVAVWATMGRPIVFSQVRPGLRGKLFRLLKFRTMTTECDEEGRLLPDDRRLPRLGAFLRRTSLDELPQLWNVLRGELSLVGPRPLMPQYLSRYTPEQARRHDVLPGITGWTQVNGRNAIDWDEKFRLDVWYVDNWSLLLDFRILLKTVATVVLRGDAAPAGRATMPEFMGSEKPDAQRTA
jgi:sugar transferase EpsL